MNDKLSRRKLITTGLATAAGVSGLAVAAKLANHYGLIPPDYGGVYGVGETLTYGAQRLLMSSRHSFAREFNRSQISKVIPVSGPPPETDPYQRQLAEKFANWRLTVDGLATNPSIISRQSRKQPGMPMRENTVMFTASARSQTSPWWRSANIPDESRATIDQAPSTTNWNITVP